MVHHVLHCMQSDVSCNLSITRTSPTTHARTHRFLMVLGPSAVAVPRHDCLLIILMSSRARSWTTSSDRTLGRHCRHSKCVVAHVCRSHLSVIEHLSTLPAGTPLDIVHSIRIITARNVWSVVDGTCCVSSVFQCAPVSVSP